MQDSLAAGGKLATFDLARTGTAGEGPDARPLNPGAAWADTWPASGATLDLDFANNRSFVRGVGQGSSMQAITFTRASNGTYIDSTGTLQTAGYGNNIPATYQVTTTPSVSPNQLTYSQTFTNSVWLKANTSIGMSNITAPDGSSTASSLIESAGLITANIVHSGTGASISIYNKASIHVKAISGSSQRYVAIGYQGGGGTRWGYWLFNPNDGTILGSFIDGVQDSVYLPSVTNMGDGWYRISVIFLTPLSGQRFTLTLTNTATPTNNITLGSYTGDGSSGVYIWGAQSEFIGTSIYSYQPRFDWANISTVSRNLLSYTESFGSVWATGGTGTAVTSNSAAAPDGSLTADIINFSTTSQYIRYNLVLAQNTYTFSIYIQAGTLTNISVYSPTQSTAYGCVVDLSTNSFSSVGSSITGYSCTDVGNGWKRIVITSAGSSVGSNGPGINATAATGTGTVYAWGAQLEVGDTVTAYQAVAQPTTSTPLASNTTCNGLLIEESRTNRLLWCRDATQYLSPARNLLRYSEQFDNAYWSKYSLNAFGSGSVSNTSATTDPIGGNTADYIQEDTTASTLHGVSIQYSSYGALGTPYTYSVYAKAAERSVLCLSIYNGLGNSQGTARSAYFDLTNGVATAHTDVPYYNIESAGLGWYRCSIGTTSPLASFITNLMSDTYPSGTVSAGLPTYTGNGASGLYLWGAQLDYATSASTYEQTTTTGALWAKNGVTVVKDQTGVDGVATTATSITATATNGTLIQSVVVASGSRTISIYLKRITGIGNIQVSIDGSTWSTVDLSSTEWRRIVISATVTNPSIGIRLATNGDAVAMDYGQIEDGAFATSPILTTTTTVTRSADAASMSTVSWFNPSKGTVQCSFTGINPGNQYLIWYLRGPLTNSSIAIYMHRLRIDSSNSPSYSLSSATSSGAVSFGGSTYTNLIPLNITTSFNQSQVNGVLGSVLKNSTCNGDVPTAIDTLWLSANGTANTDNKWLKRFTYSPIYITIDGLVQISSRY